MKRNRINTNEIEIIQKVDEQIETLSDSDHRRLMSVIGSYYRQPLMSCEQMRSLGNQLHKSGIKIYAEASDAHRLYEKAGVTETDRQIHWMYYRGLRWDGHVSYNKMPENPRQDNKIFINYGSAHSNCRKIRYPKKCRKTAWKRFYKLFPN